MLTRDLFAVANLLVNKIYKSHLHLKFPELPEHFNENHFSLA